MGSPFSLAGYLVGSPKMWPQHLSSLRKFLLEGVNHNTFFLPARPESADLQFRSRTVCHWYAIDRNVVLNTVLLRWFPYHRLSVNFEAGKQTKNTNLFGYLHENVKRPVFDKKSRRLIGVFYFVPLEWRWIPMDRLRSSNVHMCVYRPHMAEATSR